MNPLTRSSVLDEIKDLKLRDAAWAKFQREYRPPIDGWLAAHGVQPADAAKLTDQILLKLLSAPLSYEFSPSSGRYRTWLEKVVTTTISDFNHARQFEPTDQGGGREGSHQFAAPLNLDTCNDLVTLIGASAAADPDLKTLVERVRAQVGDDIWRAWELLAEMDEESVARTLRMNLGLVDKAKRQVPGLLQRTYADLLSATVHSEGP